MRNSFVAEQPKVANMLPLKRKGRQPLSNLDPFCCLVLILRSLIKKESSLIQEE